MATALLSGLPPNNDHLTAGPECYRLIKHWEKGPERVKVDGEWVLWPRSAEGAALKAYQCSAGKWTISFGVRWHPDGRPVVEGDTITEDQVMPYLEAAMGRVVADVRKAVTYPLTQFQMDALVVWVFNLGVTRLLESSELLPSINAGRWQDAAVAMGAFIYATTIAGDGKPWKRALLGLLIRRYTEGALLLGYDGIEATKRVAIELPTRRDYQPEWVNPETGEKGRYKDEVLSNKTPFKVVLEVAQSYPLQAAPVVQARPAPAPAKEQPPVLKPAGPPTTLPPVVAGEGGVKPPHRETKMPEGIPYGIDPTAGAKPMETTERFIGAAMLWLANGLRVGMANGMKLSGGLGFVTVLFLDMMKSPVTAAVMLSSLVALVCFVGWLLGVGLEKAGLRKKKRGEQRASQLMY